MNSHSASLTVRLRQIRLGKLHRERQFQELIALADVDDDVVFGQVDRILRLRHRIAALERKVHELEVQR